MLIYRPSSRACKKVAVVMKQSKPIQIGEEDVLKWRFNIHRFDDIDTPENSWKIISNCWLINEIR